MSEIYSFEQVILLQIFNVEVFEVVNVSLEHIHKYAGQL